MPRRYQAASRATVDLHRPSWSEAKGPDGRYLERAVVYASLTHADAQEIQRAMFASGDMDMGTLMQLAAAAKDVAPGADPTAVAAAMGDKIEFKKLSGLLGNDDTALLIRLAELTDADGVPMPLRDANGRLLPGAALVVSELDEADVTFIKAELARLDAGDVLVPVLPEDAAVAAQNAARVAAGMPLEALGEGGAALTTPEGVAQDSFRGDAGAGAAGPTDGSAAA